MTPLPTMPDLRIVLERVADPSKAADMSRYMKDQFAFMGVTSPERRKAVRGLVRGAKGADPADVLDFAGRCWTEPEREFQYVAVDVLRAAQSGFSPSDLPALRELVESKSWWDTVDGLAAWVVGPLVGRHPDLAAVMDDWSREENIWIARTAILHQLGHKERTDAARLFSYAERLAEHPDFFIRKALGWALRQYGRVDPDAVREFVAANESRLSGLTKREALRHVGR